LKLLLEKSFEHLLGAATRLLALLEHVVTQSSLDTVIPLVFGQNPFKSQMMEYDMKDGWALEEYLEYLKHLLDQVD
jgi:hypothetical protein